MKSISSANSVPRRPGRWLVLAGVASVFALAGVSTALAQFTTGSVFGKAPAGYAVSVHSKDIGFGRTVRVNAKGRYSADQLPIGVYTVTLKNKDRAIAMHLNVPVIVGSGARVDFDCSKLRCDEIADKEAGAEQMPETMSDPA